jgi:ApaG protein
MNHQILVHVSTSYLEAQSTPSANHYVFAYTITLENTGSVPARLLNRYWKITHGTGRVEEVRGPGVVGEHPHLAPGESYQYTSGAIIESAVGTMQGHYEMEADDGHRFKADIPSFTLSVPRTLH